MSNNKVTKVTVNMHGEALDALRQMAADQGRTLTEVIRGAIGTEKFLRDEIAAGGKILIEGSNGKFRQIMMR